MDATPFEHEVVAVATKLTLVPTVLPFAGLDTVTPANDLAAKRRTNVAAETRSFFIWDTLQLGFIGLGPGKALHI